MIKQIRILLKKNIISNWIYNILKSIYYYIYVHMFKRKFIYVNKKLNNIYIKNIFDTVYVLLNSNKSIGRFGDGELSWILGNNSGLNSFEKPSSSLSNALLTVLDSNDSFMVGLPNQFISLRNYNKSSRNYWIRYMVKNMRYILPHLDEHKIYYNADVTRPYMDFINKKDAGLIFYLIRKIWKNKNLLIIEGSKSRIGVKDDLLSTACSIKRIECPSTNAFESIDEIENNAISFLSSHPNYISLISLGPTATVLAYNLYKHGFRAIDIGNIDIEYNWYKLGANHKVNLSYKYVNELLHGQNALPINKNSRYYKEIIGYVK